MQLTEAIEKLKRGIKVRHVSWRKNEYVYLNQNSKNFYMSEGGQFSLSLKNLDDLDNWEEFYEDGVYLSREYGTFHLCYTKKYKTEWYKYVFSTDNWIEICEPDESFKLELVERCYVGSPQLEVRIIDNVPF